MSNTIAEYIIITFSIINNPYLCHPYMSITENYSSKFNYVLLGSCHEIPRWKWYSQKISAYVILSLPHKEEHNHNVN